ncbi:MAG: hypothetical protein AB2A00_31875 [Myxococcota bacterium]
MNSNKRAWLGLTPAGILSYLSGACVAGMFLTHDSRADLLLVGAGGILTLVAAVVGLRESMHLGATVRWVTRFSYPLLIPMFAALVYVHHKAQERVLDRRPVIVGASEPVVVQRNWPDRVTMDVRQCSAEGDGARKSRLCGDFVLSVARVEAGYQVSASEMQWDSEPAVPAKMKDMAATLRSAARTPLPEFLVDEEGYVQDVRERDDVAQALEADLKNVSWSEEIKAQTRAMMLAAPRQDAERFWSAIHGTWHGEHRPGEPRELRYDSAPPTLGGLTVSNVLVTTLQGRAACHPLDLEGRCVLLTFEQTVDGESLRAATLEMARRMGIPSEGLEKHFPAATSMTTGFVVLDATSFLPRTAYWRSDTRAGGHESLHQSVKEVRYDLTPREP